MDTPSSDNNCLICQQPMHESESLGRTPCSHTFHKACLKIRLQTETTCPKCHVNCDPKGKRPGGVQTRQQAANMNTNLSESAHTSTIQAQKQSQLEQIQQEEILDNMQGRSHDCVTLEPNLNTNLQAELRQVENEDRISQLVSAIVQARQASMLEELEVNLTQRLENKIDISLANIVQQMQQLNVNRQQPRASLPQHNSSQERNVPVVEPNYWPRELPAMTTPLSTGQFNRQIDNMNLSDVSLGSNSNRIAQLIRNWDIKFDGTSKLSVDSFIYRIESQVIDTLGGNFNYLCENVQSLLMGDAKDWYWNYRRTVHRVTWPAFCNAIRLNFEEHKNDTEIKENIRSRKQGNTETFDEYRNAIFKLTERLDVPIAEPEMVEILQRGLRPRIRQQLLYVPITSIAELRKLCIKGESLQSEISKVTNLPLSNTRFPRRAINEVEIDFEEDPQELIENTEVDEIAKQPNLLCCWNCKQKGHRYHDCLEERTIFCYGCGTTNVYKPSCTRCNPGNGKQSENLNRKSRNDKN